MVRGDPDERLRRVERFQPRERDVSSAVFAFGDDDACSDVRASFAIEEGRYRQFTEIRARDLDVLAGCRGNDDWCRSTTGRVGEHFVKIADRGVKGTRSAAPAVEHIADHGKFATLDRLEDQCRARTGRRPKAGRGSRVGEPFSTRSHLPEVRAELVHEVDFLADPNDLCMLVEVLEKAAERLGVPRRAAR